MADTSSGPADGKGVVEDAKVKEAAGNDSLQREGQAQQDKAEALREVAQKEAAAEKAGAKASLGEARERAER